MKMRPLSCNFGLPLGSTRFLFEYLFLALFKSMFLQHSNMVSNR